MLLIIMCSKIVLNDASGTAFYRVLFSCFILHIVFMAENYGRVEKLENGGTIISVVY